MFVLRVEIRMRMMSETWGNRTALYAPDSGVEDEQSPHLQQ